MPYKMVGKIPAPPPDPLFAYEAFLLASQIAKREGAEKFYFGIPNREEGTIVKTKEELLYVKRRFIPEILQKWWHKMFPPRSWEWGVYIEVDKSQ
jgi:hypothetical protein